MGPDELRQQTANVTNSFEHALVALDQSEASNAIIDCLPHVKKFGTRKVTLFTSVPVTYQGGPSKDEEQKWRDNLESYAAKLAKTTDFAVDTRAAFKVNAFPPHHILEGAHEAGADYIIIANRGYNKFREFLLGNTVSELLQLCDMPVFLNKLSMSEASHKSGGDAGQHDTGQHDTGQQLYCTGSCRDNLKHVLYPTDFSVTARRAFDILTSFATENIERITLYHVQAKGKVDLKNPAQLEEFNRIDRERLQVLKEELEGTSKADIDIALSHGVASRQIIEKAKSVKATMIIMGSQGRGYMSDLFLGGVTYQVLRNTPVPAMIIPARRST